MLVCSVDDSIIDDVFKRVSLDVVVELSKSVEMTLDMLDVVYQSLVDVVADKADERVLCWAVVIDVPIVEYERLDDAVDDKVVEHVLLWAVVVEDIAVVDELIDEAVDVLPVDVVEEPGVVVIEDIVVVDELINKVVPDDVAPDTVEVTELLNAVDNLTFE